MRKAFRQLISIVTILTLLLGQAITPITVLAQEATDSTVVETSTASDAQVVAVVYTDKSDYTPIEKVLIYGDNFTTDSGYTVAVTSNDPPPVDFETQVNTDNIGSFTTSYQLDGTYRPNYLVEVKDSSGNVVATTTFTDSRAATSVISPIVDTTSTSNTYIITLTNTNTSPTTTGIGSITFLVPTGYSDPTSITITFVSGLKNWSKASTGGFVNGYNSTTRKIGLVANSSGDELGNTQNITFTVATTSPSSAATYTWTTAVFSNSVVPFTGTTFTVSSQPTVTVSAPADVTPPVTTDDVDGLWHNTNVTVHFSCTDAGSGCATTYYTTDGLDPTTSSDSGNSVILSTEGVYTIKYFSVDNDGNTENVKTATNTVKIDKTNPIITGSASPDANGNGWNNTDVIVSFSCADALSGVDTDTVAGDTLSSENAGQSVINTGTCTDNAGNTADPATVSDINIDKTGPDVTIITPPDGAFYIRTHPVTADWTASDALSGLDGVPAATTPDGSLIDTATTGVKSFTVTATDLAGNETSLTHEYTVETYNTNGGVLPPIKIDGKTFKKTSTIPVKFKLSFSNGSPVIDALALLYVIGPLPDTTSVPGVSSGGSNTDNQFRYDSTGQQYIFNLSTKLLTAGKTYNLDILLDDGQHIIQPIILK